MLKLKRLLTSILMIVMLSFSMTAAPGLTAYSTAEAAAVKAPTVKTANITLYAGYKNYKIEFKNKAAKASVSFKSSDTKVATVAKDGTVKPLSAGKTVITAAIKQNSKTYNLKVTVSVSDPYIELTAASEYLNIGETFVFQAKSYGLKEKVTWSVSDDTVAGISTSGKVTAKAAGEVTVTAAAGNVETIYNMVIGSNRLGTLTRNISCYNKQKLYITVYEPVENETLSARTLSDSNDIISFEWNKSKTENVYPITITPGKEGTDTLIIESDKSSDKLYINVTSTVKDDTRTELSAKEIYAKCGSATVEISAYTESESEYIGSGFFIDNGLIVTNYHVIEGTNKIIVKTQDNKQYNVKEIAGYNKAVDLAILKIDSENPYLTISQDGPSAGEDIYTLGSPLGLTGTISGGMVTTASRVIDDVDFIQINAPISPGNSGGPLVNTFGEVLGVNTMYMVNGQNLNFAVNIDQLYQISTSKPLTVAAYYELYSQEWAEAYEKNKIYEDPTVSQDPKTCQEITPFTGVVGEVSSTEYGDCYYFTTDTPVNLIGMIKLNSMEESDYTYFALYNYDTYDFVAGGYLSKSEPFQMMTYKYLLPGNYFICIYTEDGYAGAPIPYTFFIGLTLPED